LLVDDEPGVLDVLSRYLRLRYVVAAAHRGREALALIEREAPFAVIVSDMRMPEMNGAEFLAQARRLAPDAVRILLTGESDLASAITAVNQGEIFRFLQKPCVPELLEASISAAAERHRLIVSERVLLQETLAGSIAVLTDVLALANPVAFSRSLRLKRSVSALAEVLGIGDRWAIELAAVFSQLGAITLAPAQLDHVGASDALTDEERARVSSVAEQLIRHIPRLEPVREILALRGARFDGRGNDRPTPRGEALPIGSRILCVALDHDALIGAGSTPSASVSILEGRQGAHDPAVLAALRQVVTAGEKTEDVREVRLADVCAGMIFDRDVVAANGLVLIGRGQEVSVSVLQRINNHWGNLPLRDVPRVIMPASTTIQD
jgi:response regulator RpfG family c-di-GMP phosphodiesterase